MLAAAGIWSCRDNPLDCHPLLQQFGAIPQKNQRVVESGKVITTAGVSAGIDLGLMIAVKLHGEEVAQKIQLLIEYDPMPPVNAGHPSKALEKCSGLHAKR